MVSTHLKNIGQNLESSPIRLNIKKSLKPPPRYKLKHQHVTTGVYIYIYIWSKLVNAWGGWGWWVFYMTHNAIYQTCTNYISIYLSIHPSLHGHLDPPEIPMLIFFSIVFATFFQMAYLLCRTLTVCLGPGFNPLGKIWVTTGNLPSRGKNKKHSKPPPSYCMQMGLTLVRIMEEYLGSNCLLRSLPAGYPHFPHWNQGTIFQDHKTHMLHVWYIYLHLA